MEKEQGEILGLDDLKKAEWQKRALHSVELAHGKESIGSTGESEAQEVLLSFIMNLGGVRKDVYEYLMSPRFHSTVAATVIGQLLCYGAPVEWIRLSAEILENNKTAGTFYVNEITEAYKQGMPFDAVSRIVLESDTAFKMCRERFCYRNQSESLSTKTKEVRTPELDITETVTSAVLTAMQIFMKKNEGKSTVFAVPKNKWSEPAGQTVKEETHLRQIQGESGEFLQNAGVEDAKLEPAEYAETESLENADEEVPLDEETLENEGMSQEEMPDFPDGEDIMDNRTLVKELQEAEKSYGERVSFFQILLNRHMRKTFEKLDKEAQIAKIFEIMVEKKYGKEKILAIRYLMNGGMTNEFVFSLLEKDLPEEELRELCETLVDDMPFGESEAEVSV